MGTNEERKEEIEQEITDLKEELEPLNERMEVLENNDNIDEYEEMLDDISQEVRIGNCRFMPSQILRECDPIGYRCGHSDYNDSLLSELQEVIDDKEQEIKDLEKEKGEL